MDGLIESVGSGSRLTGDAVVDCGDRVLMPGFVNAHTHLQLTHLAGVCPPDQDFAGWLSRMLAHRSNDPDPSATFVSSTQQGRRLSLEAGVTTVGDITTDPTVSRPLLRDGPLRVVSFGEVIAIGKIRDRLAQSISAAADTSAIGRYVQPALSPHAPYTLEPEGLITCARISVQSGLRICIHAAETEAEAEFCESGTGPFRANLEFAGVWDDHIPTAGCRPVELVARSGLLTPRTIIAHANYVNNGDISLIAESGAHVAYCPRTHAAFEHGPHRYRDMLAAGINVCVATDSLASNPSLSVIDELRFLADRDRDVAGETLIEMVTIRAARALNLGVEIGSLSPGKWGDVVSIPTDARRPSDVYSDILNRTDQPRIECISGLPF